jgi:EAL domain-containing protein (putative c-di-GMP-specific phosphodiesterase class I)/CheY-like chemotaxis protein
VLAALREARPGRAARSTAGRLGIAVGHGGSSVAELLQQADLAMYRAKALGKATLAVFDPSMLDEARTRVDRKVDLAQAVSRNQMVLHYQPLVALSSEKIVGVEALVRWAHPQHGLMPPDAFIPLAEETGLILPIGEWVLDEACRQVRTWQEQYPSDPPFSLSVNVSPCQFLDPSLVTTLAAATRKAGLDPRHVTLEITESVLMTDCNETLRTLHELKALGIKLAVDDFGAGYSSLTYLKRFEVDTLKIDRALVEGVGRTAEDSAVARAVVELAQSLGLESIAEGVERPEQAAELRALGCGYGQGFLFSKPCDPETLTALLASSRMVPSATVATRRKGSQSSVDARQTVLVVDDDPVIVDLLVDVLLAEGYNVRTATQGSQALHAIGESTPDAVILDVMMPEANGIRVLESVRSNPAMSGVPVLLLTGRTDVMTEWAGWHLGCDGYMMKPFDPLNLVIRLDYLLRAETEAAEAVATTAA